MGSRRADLAASFQAAVVEQLVGQARARPGARAGGRRSRSAAASRPTARCARRVGRLCEERGLRLKLVPLELCTDNAAMIGAAAAHVPAIAYPDYLAYDAFASGERRGGVTVARPSTSGPGCHLCDEARRGDVACRGGPAFGLGRSTSRATTSCSAAYLERIPVVAVDGEVVSELILDRGALLARLDTVGA